MGLFNSTLNSSQVKKIISTYTEIPPSCDIKEKIYTRTNTAAIRELCKVIDFEEKVPANLAVFRVFGYFSDPMKIYAHYIFIDKNDKAWLVDNVYSIITKLDKSHRLTSIASI